MHLKTLLYQFGMLHAGLRVDAMLTIDFIMIAKSARKFKRAHLNAATSTQHLMSKLYLKRSATEVLNILQN